MRSGTSFFDLTIFKKTILRFWPVWASYSVAWFVALPLNGLMMLRLDAESYRGLNDGHILNFARDVVPNLRNMSLILAAAFGVLAAMAVCSHLYSAKSANFFGSLPVRREGMFLTHYLAGLCFLIVPSAVIFLFTLLIEAVGGAVFLPELLFWLWVNCGECLFFYSMAVFCGMFTGHILALPAFYMIFNWLAFVMYELLTWVFRSFYHGFDGLEEGTSNVVRWLTPIWHLGRSVGQTYGARVVDGTTTMYSVTNGLTGMDIVAAYAAAGVALTVGAFLLYRVRRLESAGDVVSVKPMRPVFKYSVSVCAGLCFGMITAQAVYMHEPGLMVSMLVWAVIGYFVAQMMLDKTFRVFKKWKGAAAVAGVFILMYLVVGFDLTGYETRVPTVDQVDYVEFNGFGMCYLNDDGDHLCVEKDNPSFVERAILLHQTAVDQRNMENYNGYDTVNLYLTYHLKNGSTLTRRYSLWVNLDEADQEGTAAWVIQQMYNDRELYWEVYGFEEAERRIAEEGYRLEDVSFSDDYHAESVDQTLYYYGKDAQALYAAVKEDFQAGRIGVRSVGSDRNWGAVQHNLTFSFSNNKKWLWDIDIYVQDTASSTLAVLERLAQEGGGEYIKPEAQRWGILDDGSVAAYPTVSSAPVPTSEE